MFRHRIGCGAYLAEQSGGRGSVQQITLTSLQHAGQYRAGRKDVGHDVNLPDFLPGLDGHLFSAGGKNPRICAEKINLTKSFKRLLNERVYRLLIAHITRYGHAFCLISQSGKRFRHTHRIDIGNDHGLCAFFGKTFTQSTADSTGGTGHDNNLIPDFH